MCLCTMRESCSECESPDFYTKEKKNEDPTEKFTFGQEVFYYHYNDLKSGKYCAVDDDDSDVLMIRVNNTMTRIEASGVFSDKVEAFKHRINNQIKSLMKDNIENRAYIERYNKFIEANDFKIEELKNKLK